MNASGATPASTASASKREQTEPTATLEVEVKFSAPEEAVAPGFDFVPGVAGVDVEVREMSAMYVDTADLRLTRAKRTLRRRCARSSASIRWARSRGWTTSATCPS